MSGTRTCSVLLAFGLLTGCPSDDGNDDAGVEPDFPADYASPLVDELGVGGLVAIDELALADDGTLYFTDVRNHCVRAIDPDGTIRTAVGQCGVKGFAGDGGPPEDALLNLPFGVEWANGTLVVSDTGNGVIRTIRMQ